MSNEGAIQSLDDARESYAGEWIAATVFERDASNQPVMVQVVVHHYDRYRLRDYIPAGLEVCIFFGGGPTKEGYQLL